MYQLMTIIEREVDNTDLVYIYHEEAGWYAYEQSALFLKSMLGKQLKTEHFVVDNTLCLIRTRVDIAALPRTKVISYSKYEYVLYRSENEEYHEWLCNLPHEKAI